MSAMRTTTQADIDAVLLKELGIKPTEKFTKDSSQQLYVDRDDNGLMLPASVQGYSYYAADHILKHAQKKLMVRNLVEIRSYEATPAFKIVGSEKED